MQTVYFKNPDRVYNNDTLSACQTFSHIHTYTHAHTHTQTNKNDREITHLLLCGCFDLDPSDANCG